jgi:hypothetical protein
MTVRESGGVARPRLSSVELFGRSPANRAPRLRACGWNMEVDAGDYPGGDPQNGQ